MSKISEALNAERRIPASSLERWMLTLDKDDQAAILNAAQDVRVSDQKLTAFFAKHGYPAHKTTISDWRKAHGLNR